MLTHDEVDYGPHRAKHAFHSADGHSLLETPVTELCGLGRGEDVIGLLPMAFATYSALRLAVLLKVVPSFPLIER